MIKEEDLQQFDSDLEKLSDSYRDMIKRFPLFGMWYAMGFAKRESKNDLYSLFYHSERETDSSITLPRLSVIRAKHGYETIENADGKTITAQIQKAVENLTNLEKLCFEIQMIEGG
jgi:hypothetical protein